MKQFVKFKFTTYLLVTLFCVTSITEAKNIMGNIYLKIINATNRGLFAYYNKTGTNVGLYTLFTTTFPYSRTVSSDQSNKTHYVSISIDQTLPKQQNNFFANMQVDVIKVPWKTGDEIKSNDPEKDLESYFKDNSLCVNITDSGLTPKLSISGNLTQYTFLPTTKAEKIIEKDDTIYNIIVKCYIRQDVQKKEDKVLEKLNPQREIELKDIFGLGMIGNHYFVQ